ncbi:MAG: hypothetical protein R3C03_02020 [Pirellulaceae bacterium]
MQNVVFRIDLIFMRVTYDVVKNIPIDCEIAAAPYGSKTLFEFVANRDHVIFIKKQNEQDHQAGKGNRSTEVSTASRLGASAGYSGIPEVTGD